MIAHNLQIKELTFGDEGRLKMKQGVIKVAKAVSVTLGPHGQVVSIDHSVDSPTASKDGVTVARNIKLKDPVENMGAKYTIESAMKTVSEAGDGTTTTTMLIHALYCNAVDVLVAHNTTQPNWIQKLLKIEPASSETQLSSVKLKRAMDALKDLVVESIKSNSVDVKDDNAKLRDIAMISANNNDKVADLILEAIGKVGQDGLISMKFANDDKTRIELVDGCDIDQGFLVPEFVNTNRATCEFSDALICCIDGPMTNFNDVRKLTDEAVATKKPLVFIADEFHQDILSLFLTNIKNKKVQACVVRSPGLGDRRRQYMQDIAAVCGATIIGGTESGVSLKNAGLEHLGSCERFIAKRNSSVIIGGDANKAEVEKRLIAHEAYFKEATDEVTKEFIKKQISRLKGGVAIIHVGGKTTSEQHELGFLVEDALLAVRAASEEGISPGGGINYLKAIDAIQRDEDEEESIEMTAARNIMERALKAITTRLVVNNGEDPEKVINHIRKYKKQHPLMGYDAKNGTYVENMVVAGITDPTKVQRVSFQNAVSIAGIMLQTEATISQA